MWNVVLLFVGQRDVGNYDIAEFIAEFLREEWGSVRP